MKLHIGEKMNNEEKLHEFTFYTCFKVTQSTFNNKELPERIKICANQAYLDFCRTIDYNHYVDEEKKYSEKEWKEKVDELMKQFYEGTCDETSIYDGLIPSMVKMISEKDETEYNKKHKELCVQISQLNAPILNNKLTIGQAQKWINMTIKYLWINGLVSEEIYGSLHVPIDNYILEKVYYILDNKGQNDFITKAGDQFKVKEKGVYKPWSQITDYDGCYKTVQAKIREISENPIEWEFKTWLEAAQNKKSN